MAGPPSIPSVTPVASTSASTSTPLAHPQPGVPETAATATDLPPTYAPTQPQILVAPLPDSPSFFWGCTVQGEIFVKGLGEGGSRGVQSLSVQLSVIDSLPGEPAVELEPFPLHTIWPSHQINGEPLSPVDASSSASPTPFHSMHRFCIPLPASLSAAPSSAIPGTLDLSVFGRGEIRWSLAVLLTLSSGEVVRETVRIEGTPQELGDVEEPTGEVEQVLDRSGVRVRLLLDKDRPRLGELVRAGVEVRPKERTEKTGLAGLVAQPGPAETLRPLRRVRVELFRRIDFTPSGPSSSSPIPPVLTLLHSSGKSLRYPGAGHAPLRVLFTLRTAGAGAGAGADPTWGEITSGAAYHRITFFVRVTLGFGATVDPGSLDLSGVGVGASGASSSGAAGMGGGAPQRDWVVERAITIRPRLWVEPTEVFVEGGMEPASSMMTVDGVLDDERAAYRLKGRDVVGETGTFRPPTGEDGALAPPPPFAEAGPSHSNGDMEMDNDRPPPPPPPPVRSEQSPGVAARVDCLPSFVESQAQMRSGHAPPVANAVMSTRLTPAIGDTEAYEQPPRPVSLDGELGTWIEYDGYETFSMAPPPAAASFGVDSIMDPPREGDEDARNVVGGMVARLGLSSGSGSVQPGDLMAQLGLGEGSRVIDLQDDLPPGIDEPSLPALPGFNHTRSFTRSPPFTGGVTEPDHLLPPPSPPLPPLPPPESPHLFTVNPDLAGVNRDLPPLPPPDAPRGSMDVDIGVGAGSDRPPSFAASEAAVAAGGVARSRAASAQGGNHGLVLPLAHGIAHGLPHGQSQVGQIQGQGGASVPESESGDAPPGYFGTGGGPPAYS